VIPFSTTTITIYRRSEDDAYAEPYSGLKPTDRDVVAEAVRAVIDVPVGRQAGIERNRGGESVRTELRLVADPIDLLHTDQIRDDTTGVFYDISWIVHYPDGPGDAGGHIEAGIVNIEGTVS
jgi:hypothetical protein